MKTDTVDAILVLGGGIGVDGSLQESCKAQVEKAIELYYQYHAKAVIFSGLYGYKGTETPVMSEARAYANYAETLGFDPDATILEERAQESLGNVVFTKQSILIPRQWTSVLVVPTPQQLEARIEYMMQKVLGPGYQWAIERIGEDLSEENVRREMRSLQITREINDPFTDGDDGAIYDMLMKTHPAYGGTRWTIEELREKMSKDSH